MPWWNRKPSASETEDAEDLNADADDVLMPPAAGAASPPPAPPARVFIIGARADDAILSAAKQLGVTSAEDLKDMHAVASAARGALAKEVKKQAVRCFGPENGPLKAEALKSASYSDAQSMAALWQETADAKYGVGKDGQVATPHLARTGHSAIPPQAEDASAAGSDTRPAATQVADGYISARYARPDGQPSDANHSAANGANAKKG